jgi:hypothetical protein
MILAKQGRQNVVQFVVQKSSIAADFILKSITWQFGKWCGRDALECYCNDVKSMAYVHFKMVM